MTDESMMHLNALFVCSIILHFASISARTVQFTCLETHMLVEIFDTLHNGLALATDFMTVDKLILHIWVTK